MKTARREAAGVAVALFALLCWPSATPRAELRLDITSGEVRPMPIAIPPFAASADGGQAGREIPGVVSADLGGSGLFRPLDPRSFIEDVSTTDSQPNFADWRPINAQASLPGRSGRKPTGASMSPSGFGTCSPANS